MNHNDNNESNDKIVDLGMMLNNEMTFDEKLEMFTKSYDILMEDYNNEDVSDLEISFVLGMLVSSIIEDENSYYEDEDGMLHDDCDAAKFLFALDDAMLDKDMETFNKVLKDRLVEEEKYEYIIALKL